MPFIKIPVKFFFFFLNLNYFIIHITYKKKKNSPSISYGSYNAYQDEVREMERRANQALIFLDL